MKQRYNHAGETDFGCGTFATCLDDVVEREPRYTLTATNDRKKREQRGGRLSGGTKLIDLSILPIHCRPFVGYV